MKKYSKYVDWLNFDDGKPNKLLIGMSLIVPLGVILILDLGRSVGIGWLIAISTILILLSLIITALLLALVSYPFRCAKIKRLINSGKCFTVETAGTIFGCRVYNGNTEGLYPTEHDWDDCVCKRCGKTRYVPEEDHDWDGCKCKRCGKTRDEQHDWDGCKCKKCGAERQHDWDGCKCKRCGKTRDVPEEDHDWDGCKCKRCGKTRDEQHDWNGCRCKRCGKTRDEQHDWETIESVTSSEPGWYGDTPIDIITTSSFSRCRICGEKTEETSSEDMECRH